MLEILPGRLLFALLASALLLPLAAFAPSEAKVRRHRGELIRYVGEETPDRAAPAASRTEDEDPGV